MLIMTIAEYIANQLFNHGVRYVFGIPGGPSIPYLEAFKEAGIEFILTSNEASAGIMADVTARLTGIRESVMPHSDQEQPIFQQVSEAHCLTGLRLLYLPVK